MAGILFGNARAIGVASITISPALIAQGTTAEQTFTCTGLQTTDMVIGVSKPTTQAGLGIVGWRVSAADTIAITFCNVPNAGGNITPTASQTYQVAWLRPDSVQTAVAQV